MCSTALHAPPADHAFNADLIRRYDVNGPRYTSYPTAVEFRDEDLRSQYTNALESLPDDAPLSLYIHVPFCPTICYYCACNKINTGNHKHADAYIDRLAREIELQASLVPHGHLVEQLHFGGGTPTFLNEEQMARVFEVLGSAFNLCSDQRRDFSIEIDPRGLPLARVDRLAELGFNRMSIGVQDFEPKVQAAINRIQSEDETQAVVTAARVQGFGSVSFDLIYGLPGQTVPSFRRTLERVVRLDPDRISIYNYAHLPHLFKTQRQINEEDSTLR